MGDRRRHSELLRHNTAAEVNEGGEETSSRQEYQGTALEIPACRSHVPREGTRNHDRDSTGRHRYTSYKVANLPIEFSRSIPRAQLRPGYGDGFRGAPLQSVPPRERPSPRVQGGHRGTSRTHRQHNPGSAYHV